MKECANDGCWDLHEVRVESASFVMAGMDSAVVGTNGNHLSGSSSSPLPPLVFKVADNQVAGHRFEEGRVGSLIDDSGRFYKPLQTGARGDKEVNFFKRFHSDVNVPSSVKSFFPNFFGTIEIDTPNGGGLVRHAVMENLTNGFQHPSVMDVKIGFRTWYLEAGPKYVEKCKLKDQETTSAALGIRVSGMMVYEANKGEAWKAGRDWCKYIKTEAVSEALVRFASSNPSAEKEYDGAFCKAVYGATLTELQKLKSWFEEQKSYHFHSASVLIVYEGKPSRTQTVSVRLVDFAHVVYDKNEIDDNFLSGLNALMKMLTEIIDSVGNVDTSASHK
nr:inositol polyphosphate multikinase alpha-like isoform X5 [Physcomitrium patens]|eukprot:XP_024385607.1 inositol polyphosphate multikinase alpha-like isoform X5 [Physcomitrella patens]